MSMILTLVKVGTATHGKIVDSRGQHLTALLRGEASDDRFDRKRDVTSELDYRDLSFQAEDEEHPLFQLFQGEPLVAGYEWTYGLPAWFDPAATRSLHEALVEYDDGWPVSDITEFLGSAVAEGKGVIVGVA